jgi:hypothetical protein
MKSPNAPQEFLLLFIILSIFLVPRTLNQKRSPSFLQESLKMYPVNTQYTTGPQGLFNPSWSFPVYTRTSSETNFSASEDLNLYGDNISPLDVPCGPRDTTCLDNTRLIPNLIDDDCPEGFLLLSPSSELPSTSPVLPTTESTYIHGKDCTSHSRFHLRSRVSAFVRKTWAKQDQHTGKSHAALEYQDTSAVRPTIKQRLNLSPKGHEDRESKRTRQAAGLKWYCAGGVMIYGEDEGC